MGPDPWGGDASLLVTWESDTHNLDVFDFRDGEPYLPGSGRAAHGTGLSFRTASLSHETSTMAHMSLPEPQKLLPLQEITLNILLILAYDERRGDSIVDELGKAPLWFEGYIGLESRPEDEPKVSADDVYRSINLMSYRALIAEIDGRPILTSWEELREHPPLHNPSRRWKITPYGRSVAQAEVRRLEQLVKVAKARGFAPET